MMIKTLLMLAAVALVVTGCAAPRASANSFRQISMPEAVDMMNAEEGYIILDVRTVQEYESGHIPGAICIPNETISDKEIPQLPDKDQLIFVYCRNGNRSRQAAAKLARLGYKNIVEIGGIGAWPGEIVTA